MTTYASPTGGCNGGKSLGCSQACVSGPTLPPLISAQKGQVVTPSRRFMRWGAFTRYWRTIGFQTRGVVGCIDFLPMVKSGTAPKQDTAPLPGKGGKHCPFVDRSTIIVSGKKPLVPGGLIRKERPGNGSNLCPGYTHDLQGIFVARL